MITVTSMTRLNREPNLRGVHHLAHCTLQIGDLLTLEGCLLVDNPDQGRTIWASSKTVMKGENTACVRLGAGLRKACTQVACAAYDALKAIDAQPHRTVSAAVALVQELEARDAA